MTNPPRLLDDELDDFERNLLCSARSDRGTKHARMRALAVWGALGAKLATTTTAAASVATSSALGAGVSAAPHVAGAIPGVTVGLLAKWLGTGIVAGTLTVGGVSAVGDALRTPPPALPAGAQAPAAPTANAISEPRQPERRSGASDALPTAPAGRDARQAAENPTPTPPVPEAVLPPPVSSGVFPVEASDSLLSQELAVLERARQALGRHDAAAALRELAEYERRFRSGALSREATLLAVEARLENGDVGGARAIAARVLAVDSNSPHARRLRALLEKGDHR